MQDSWNPTYFVPLITLSIISLALAVLSAAANGLTRLESLYLSQDISQILFIILMVFSLAMVKFLKEKSLLNYYLLSRKQKVEIYRGTDKHVQQVDSEELVVGDLIILNKGQRIPADLLLIEGELQVSEEVYSQIYKPIQKRILTKENYFESPDPILLADSHIVSGRGKAVVCLVGNHT